MKRNRSRSKSRNNKPKPVVKLHPTDDKSSVDSEQDDAHTNLYDEIPSGAVKTSSELLKLKAQLAAKAKKSLEEKKTVELPAFIPAPVEIMVEKAAIAEKASEEKETRNKSRGHSNNDANKSNKIAIKPFKIHDGIDKKGVPDVFERDTQPSVGQQQQTQKLRDSGKMRPPKRPSPSTVVAPTTVRDRSPTADTTETNRSSRSTSRHSKT